MTSNRHLTFWLILLFFVAINTCRMPASAFAAVPSTMNYQGYLTDSGGTAIQGSQLINFYIYDDISGGSLVWTEQQTVNVVNGVFNVQLGAVEPLLVSDFYNDTLYLELEIFTTGSTWETLTPRQRLTTTGFAFKAANADALDGFTSSDFSVSGHNHDADYVNEGQSNSITSSMITNGSILAADLADGTALQEILDNDGAGSSLDADYLDGYSSDAFTLLSQDYGRYNVTTDLYEGTTTLSSKYVNEGQANSITGSMIVDSTIIAADLAPDSVTASEIAENAVGASEIDFPLDYTGNDANGGLVSMVNIANGSLGNYPAALYGGANGAASTQNVFGVLGTAPALGFGNDAIGRLPSAPIAVGGAAQDGYGIAGTSTSHYHAGVYANSSRGIGLYAKHTDPSFTAPAVYGINAGSGAGIVGDSSSDTDVGVLGRTTSTTGIGVRGQGAVSTNYGELGKDGIGIEAQGSVYAGKFLGDVQITGTNDSTVVDISGENTGTFNDVLQVTSAGYGSAIYAYNSRNSTDTPAVHGYHISSVENFGVGVKGEGGYKGVEGRAAGGEAGFGTKYGVYGYATGGSTNYAGYFSGNLRCTGELSKGSGTFMIDHPLDPENKYLFHSFVESPDMMNIYNGNVLLDEDGEAVVDLPDWFEALNMEFRYQLTCIGDFAQVYIAKEIENNSFTIAGGKPGMKVSWQVTGIRHDAFANAHRVQVEVDKPQDERGTYIHPKAFGVSSELQVDRVHEAAEKIRAR